MGGLAGLVCVQEWEGRGGVAKGNHETCVNLNRTNLSGICVCV